MPEVSDFPKIFQRKYFFLRIVTKAGRKEVGIASRDLESLLALLQTADAADVDSTGMPEDLPVDIEDLDREAHRADPSKAQMFQKYAEWDTVSSP